MKPRRRIEGMALLLLLIACADHSLDGLELGIAFPPLNTETELAATVSACAELGFGWARFQESWANREPKRGRFYWEPMDARIAGLEAAGVRILLTLGGHDWPAWLGSTGSHDEAETLAEFREYVAALLARYAGRIDRIQFGNEWNWEIDAYMEGDESAFIAYANILYEEARKHPEALRPTVALGSVNGLAYLAFDRGLADSIPIAGKDPYADRIAAYRAAPDRKLSARAARVLAEARYDMTDIHLYDDYPNWPAYLRAFRETEREASGRNVPVLVSEFGGPYPKNLYGFFGGRPNGRLLADELASYLRTLDAMDVEEAYFFTLFEGGKDRNHPDSFLFDASGRKTPAYATMRGFAAPDR